MPLDENMMPVIQKNPPNYKKDVKNCHKNSLKGEVEAYRDYTMYFPMNTHLFPN